MITAMEQGLANYREALLAHFLRLDGLTKKYRSPNCMDWSRDDYADVLREIDRLTGMEVVLALSKAEQEAVKKEVDAQLAKKK